MDVETNHEISIHLWEDAQERDPYVIGLPAVNGVKYDFPLDEYHYLLRQRTKAQGLSDEEAGVPSSWQQAIVEAGRVAETKGVSDAIDLIVAAHFVYSDNPAIVKEFNLKPFPVDEETGRPQFDEYDDVMDRVDDLLSNPQLRERLISKASVLIPDSSMKIENEQVLRVLQGRRGIALNLGCGVGSSTSEYADSLAHMKVIGVDRQYHPFWYRRHWGNSGNSAHFIRADAIELPLASSSVDNILLENVAGHVTQDGLEKILNEALRVLEPDGLLFVGPQYTEYEGEYSKDGDWKVYKKVKSGSESVFQRVSLSSLQSQH